MALATYPAYPLVYPAYLAGYLSLDYPYYPPVACLDSAADSGLGSAADSGLDSAADPDSAVAAVVPASESASS